MKKSQSVRTVSLLKLVSSSIVCQRYKRHLIAALFWSSCSFEVLGQSIIVTFPYPTDNIVTQNYWEQGFHFSATQLEHDPDYRDVFPDTDGMLRISGLTHDNVLRIEEVNGRPFDLEQFKIQTTAYSTPPNNFPWPVPPMSLTGVLATGGTVVWSFPIVQEWTTIDVPNSFANLLYVELPQDVFGGIQIDDVVLTPESVPDPGSLQLFCLFAGCWWAVTRRFVPQSGRSEPGQKKPSTKPSTIPSITE